MFINSFTTYPQSYADQFNKQFINIGAQNSQTSYQHGE